MAPLSGRSRKLTSLVNVNVTARPGHGFAWGFLSTRPSNIRIFKGPPETCADHPWDAIILRDCTPNTDNLIEVESISSRKWDVLCMKMCEDYDCKLLVVFLFGSLETELSIQLHGLSSPSRIREPRRLASTIVRINQRVAVCSRTDRQHPWFGEPAKSASGE